MFKCDKCGLCCRHINVSPLFVSLDRGDGVCKYYDESTALCTIYENRPILCNVEKAYNMYYKQTISIEEYYDINTASCEKLKEKYR